MTERGARAWATTAALGALALAVRWLFVHAGADADWPYAVGYKGDAPVWLRWALARRAGAAFEAGLPLRPPGTVWLVERLWDGTPEGIAALRSAWTLLGALAVVLFHRALLVPFGARVAAIAAGLAAVSTGGLWLSSSICSETPYLVLLFGALALTPTHSAPEGGPGHRDGGLLRMLGCGALHAAATLVRVEHAAFFLLFAGWFAWRSVRSTGGRRALAQTAPLLGAYAAALVPWHLTLWAAVARFNAGDVPRDAAGDRAIASIEDATGHIVWLDEARERAAALPGFTRRSACAFVSATVMHRGGGVVGLPEMSILEEAYGAWPAPVAARPFVAPYGPLNFFLANNPLATGGFGRAALQVAPRLAGGAERYPPYLVAAMPPPRLSFEYPPHLALFNEGYARGVEWIASAPREWGGLVLRKLAIFWSGASLGYTGYGVPLGASGKRRAVDLTVPTGAGAALWGLFVFGLTGAGIVACLRPRAEAGEGRSGTVPGAAPWLLYGASRLLVTALFFGYARQGALALPVVHLATAVALDRWVVPRLRTRTLPAGLAALALALGLEILRNVRGVRAELDGAAVGARDPYPSDVHVDRDVRFTAGE